MEIPKPNFIQKLQALDDGHKQKVLIIAATIIMAIIIYVWVAYFSSVVASSSAQPQTSGSVSQGAAPVSADGAKSGSIWDDAKSQIEDIYQTMTHPGQYQVNGSSTQ